MYRIEAIQSMLFQISDQRDAKVPCNEDEWRTTWQLHGGRRRLIDVDVLHPRYFRYAA